ncbi:TPA: hypothetical protein DEG21_03585 [Patescibacteria group bacterium]|nr:hypothetical protein [Candidatus Gracilibacteria bacterium]HBY74936.1 hypothetical protein [Candidatus Gracilibacteria bacterium]
MEILEQASHKLERIFSLYRVHQFYIIHQFSLNELEAEFKALAYKLMYFYIPQYLLNQLTPQSLLFVILDTF